ncbi:MAG: endosialidase [Epulopiscium sp. Nele67-Bin004]|nr:MAG: endosialidase [Epulopiscium sp. Nele67-Bin004]
MAVIKEIIRTNSDGTISFGNYELDSKTKVLDFEIEGFKYKAKSFNEVTKLKKDGELVYESIPGTAVHHFKVTDKGVRFFVEGTAQTQITLELTPDTEYDFKVDKAMVGLVKTTATGKVNISVDATAEEKLVELTAK